MHLLAGGLSVTDYTLMNYPAHSSNNYRICVIAIVCLKVVLYRKTHLNKNT